MNLSLVPLEETRKPLCETSFPIPKEVLDQMYKIMKDNKGVGLAAPQVGYYQKFFIGDLGPGMFVCANPKLYVAPESLIERKEEGCLTVPGITRYVGRYGRVRIRGFKEDGKPFDWVCIGKLARLVQHEMDHLEGRCIVDGKEESGNEASK